jgi:Fic family protein
MGGGAVFDKNWDLIDDDATAHAIEVLNYASQVNVIEALFRYAMHKGGVDENGGCKHRPLAAACRELHRTGTLFLLAVPGEYRDVPVDVVTDAGVVVYAPPPHEEVEEHMGTFFDDLGEMWGKSNPIEIAAFCLWRLNWIHPFKNGNGRTARAYTYACLCLKYGMMLPGAPTVIDLIMSNRPQYEAALRAGDLSFAEAGTADLTAMKSYLESLLVQQLSSVPAPQA